MSLHNPSAYSKFLFAIDSLAVLSWFLMNDMLWSNLFLQSLESARLIWTGSSIANTHLFIGERVSSGYLFECLFDHFRDQVNGSACSTDNTCTCVLPVWSRSTIHIHHPVLVGSAEDDPVFVLRHERWISVLMIHYPGFRD